MIATVTDRRRLEEIDPHSLLSYLAAHGWREIDRDGSKVSTWSLGKGDGEYEVYLPLDTRLRDFALRISEVLRTLAIVEHRSQIDVVNDLATVSSDTVRIRSSTPSTADGTIALRDGLGLITGASDMVLSAACATISPKALFLSRRHDRVVEYLKKVRLGQTGYGSYVITIISPLEPTPTDGMQGTLDSGEDPAPFERRVVVTLATALSEMHRAAATIERTGSFDDVDRVVSGGVSANLCESVVSMLGEAAGGAVGIHFSWSPQRAVGSTIPRSVEFRADLSAPLQAAARHLRKSAGQPATIEVLATVIRLDQAEGRSEKAILYGPVDGSTFRQIEVDMVEEIRPVAVRAYEDKTVVLCAGTLTRRGKRYIMADLTQFELAGDLRRPLSTQLRLS